MAKVSVTVDRTTIEEGESFQMIIQSNGEADYSGLQKDFDVLSTSHSSKVSIVNGSVNSIKELVLILMPKQIGTFVIPPIKAGNSASRPIQINVIKPKAIAANQGADIFLEAKVDLTKAYVQSQVVYSVRLYRAVEIREASLTEPSLNDAVVERMGEDISFQTRRNQRLYQVTERRFAIFPQKSGNYVIPAATFQGQVLEKATSNRFSNDPFDRFFQTQRARRVRIKSNEIEIEVMPQAKQTGDANWLPAKKIIFSEIWSPNPPQFKVGEPVTRTLRIEATGLTGAQLPEIKWFETNGIKQYTDQPLVKTEVAGDALLGVREEKIAIVPNESGKLVLPEIRLHWWDTEFERERIESIPSRVIEVLADKSRSENNNVNTNSEKNISENSDEKQSDVAVKIITDPGYWPWISALFLTLWLITGIAWLLKRNSRQVNQTDEKNIEIIPSESGMKQAMADLKSACKVNNPTAARESILDWAKAAWPDKKIQSLNMIASEIHDSTLKRSFEMLNQTLYSTFEQAEWDGNEFYETVHRRIKYSPSTKKNRKIKQLPELYPVHSSAK